MVLSHRDTWYLGIQKRSSTTLISYQAISIDHTQCWPGFFRIKIPSRELTKTWDPPFTSGSGRGTSPTTTSASCLTSFGMSCFLQDAPSQKAGPVDVCHGGKWRKGQANNFSKFLVSEKKNLRHMANTCSLHPKQPSFQHFSDRWFSWSNFHVTNMMTFPFTQEI